MPLDPHLADRLPLIESIQAVQPEPSPDDLELVEKFMEDPGPWSLPEVEVEDISVPGPHGPVPLRLYRPRGAAPTRALLWAHGGGFAAGTLDWNEAHVVSAELASRAGAFVASVDYRLASGTVRFPVPLDDVVAAWAWLTSTEGRAAAGGGGLPESAPIALGGASAGAALALATAVRLRDDAGHAPSSVLLAYPFAHFPVPALDDETAAVMASLPAMLRFTPESIEGMVRNYVGRISDVPALALPGHAPLENLPPVHVLLSEYDDLRPSGELLVRQLVEAGVRAQEYLARGMLHGHLNRLPSLAEVDASLEWFAEALRGL
jgi:acetyl esterase/lipase